VTTYPVAIVGLGSYLPEQVVTNDDLAQRLETSDEWIRTRTGIRERHYAAAEEATSDLALAAARRALEDAGLTPEDIDVVIVATTTPDHPVPATAPIVAASLGLTCAAFDLNAACSGFVYGLQVGAALAAVRRDGARGRRGDPHALRRPRRPFDRRPLRRRGRCGGPAGAPRASIGPFDVGSRRSRPRDPVDEGRRFTRAVRPGPHAQASSRMSMRGGDVYRHAVTRMASSSQIGPRRRRHRHRGRRPRRRPSGEPAHPRGRRQRLAIPEGRSHITVDRHGNTSAASIPLALDDARRAGLLRPGAQVLLTAFGGGLTWASCLLTWSGTRGAGDVA
jgi:3-oxoacyl-[acyl-carrier-protein] synthase III